jgi:hypothetical protein
MGRTIDGWTDLTDQMSPPAGLLEQLCAQHPEISADRAPLAWEAYLQWIRVRGRNSSRLSMCQPSLAIDELGIVIAADTQMQDEIPDQVNLIFRIPVRDPSSRAHLEVTLREAYVDELPVARLPLLFCVDESIGITEGRLYRGDCVTGDCVVQSEAGDGPEPGRTCLHGTPWTSTPVSGGGGG